MQTITDNKALAFLFATSLASALAGCLCPQCIQSPPGSANTASASGNATATSTSEAAAPAAGATAAAGDQVIWDGENAATGQSWASCDQEGKCAATLAVADGEGKGGGIGLKLHGEGTGWQGGGWNWHGWWPENAGTDLSPYDTLKFSVKVTGEAKDKLPTPGGINVTLGCSTDKEKPSADAPLGKYAADAVDGKWHDVSIPLKDFFDGKGKDCDPRTAWEIRFGSWSANAVNFDLVVDDIVATKQ